jgi:hypothetical protein
MIEFLKESTFAVNEVIYKAWAITKRNYITIIFLSVLMFITLSLSSLVSFFIKDINPILNILMFLIFIALYLTFNLSLFKYIFHLLDHEVEKARIIETLPTKRQMFKSLLANLYFTLSILSVYGIIMLIAFPFIYTGIKMQYITGVAISIGLIAIFITWIRISFFPFFIIDRNVSAFASLKLSLAITKGNFTKILILLVFKAAFQGIYFFLNYLGYPLGATIVNILISFIVVPLSTVALTIAYRQMMEEYKGEQDPEILKNIF